MSVHVDDGEDWELLTRPDVETGQNGAYNGNFYFNFRLDSERADGRRNQLSLTFEPSTRRRRGAHPLSSQRQINAPPPDLQRIVHEQSQSPLFQLPAEIRLQIYENAFKIKQAHSVIEIRQHPAPTWSVLNFLLTCRRALAEAEEIFYSVNRLTIVDSAFWSHVGVRRREAITMISLPVRSAAAALGALERLHHAPNLRSLHIERQVSIRFTAVREWRVMAAQLVTEIEKMRCLGDLRISTPKPVDLSEHELGMRSSLEEVDDRLRGAVRGRSE